MNAAHGSTSPGLVLVPALVRSLVPWLGAALVPAACGGGGQANEPVPITERALQDRYTCRLGRGPTFHAPLLWSPAPAMTVTASGTVFLARLQSEPTNPVLPAPRELMVSTFAPDGALGSPTKIGAPLTNDQSMYLAAAPRGDGVALAWMDVGSGAVSFAAVTADGQPAIAPRVIATGAAGDFYSLGIELASGGDGGFAVVHRLTAAGRAELRLLVLNADGSVRGAPRVLASADDASFVVWRPKIAPVADGYALMWAEPGGPSGRVVFAKANLDGAEVLTPRAVSVTSREGTYVGSDLALLAQGDGYLAAWTESDRGDLDNLSGASSVVRLARLDAAGGRTAAPASLRAPTVDIDEIEPSLVAFGDAVAVLWGRGNHIYICGGCVPDHRIDMLLVDPTTLDPLSAVTTVTPVPVPPVTIGGGLLGRSVAVLGSTILTAFNVTFHVHHTSASATFTCDRR